MRQAIIKYLLRFSYPQNIFTSAIVPYLDAKPGNELVDVPCGDGITSWRFSRLNNLTVYGYDISPAAIQNSKNNFQRGNLFFDAADINKAISNHNHAKYFCIINALFLLPDPGKVLAALYSETPEDSMVFIIVPNINGPNYKWFEKRNPGVNRLVLAEAEFSGYFSTYNWAIEKTVPLAYARSYGRKDVVMFSVLAPFYLTILNYLNTLLGAKVPNYFLLVLRKK
ncbi:MAG: class I SAM-dependent methyltransferase [Bacteroidia bacterium]